MTNNAPVNVNDIEMQIPAKNLPPVVVNNDNIEQHIGGYNPFNRFRLRQNYRRVCNEMCDCCCVFLYFGIAAAIITVIVLFAPLNKHGGGVVVVGRPY